MSRITREERGQGLVEYALIIALVGLAAVVALGFLSGKVNGIFSKAGNVLNNAGFVAGGGPPPPPAPGDGTTLGPGNTLVLNNALAGVWFNANQMQYCTTNDATCLLGNILGATWVTIAQPGVYSFVARSGACNFTATNNFTFAGSWDVQPGFGYYREVGDNIPLPPYFDACL